MDALLECVPNFSEGRRKDVIEAISEAVWSVDSVKLLDVDPSPSANRTVYTFVGPPRCVIQAALAAAKTAHKHIDMAQQKGEHPRLGTLDVCPFIPVRHCSMEDAVRCANEFAEQLAAELDVPVYLYEEAAIKGSHRVSLPDIRSGEYEGLPEKIEKDEWIPDYGPAKYVARWGATVCGARPFLIAYNVNMLSTKEQAHRVALDIREQGRGEDQPGKFKRCRAIGWHLDDEQMAQVSINLTDFSVTGMHHVFEECRAVAKSLRLAVVGSQLVGLVPLQAMLDSAEFYIQKEQLFITEESQKIRLVVERLGLDSLEKFKPDERIIEYVIGSNKPGPLISSSVESFVKELGSRSSAPGGGSAAAVIAAMGAGLGAMTGWMTYGKRKFEDLDAEMRLAIAPLDAAMKELLRLVDADTAAFKAYTSASHLPKSNDTDKLTRRLSLLLASRDIVEVPLSVMRVADKCWDALDVLAKHGNSSCRSDLQVGAKSLETGIYGAHQNVLINLTSLEPDLVKKVSKEAQELMERAKKRCAAVLEAVDSRCETSNSS